MAATPLALRPGCRALAPVRKGTGSDPLNGRMSVLTSSQSSRGVGKQTAALACIQGLTSRVRARRRAAWSTRFCIGQPVALPRQARRLHSLSLLVLSVVSAELRGQMALDQDRGTAALRTSTTGDQPQLRAGDVFKAMRCA